MNYELEFQNNFHQILVTEKMNLWKRTWEEGNDEGKDQDSERVKKIKPQKFL